MAPVHSRCYAERRPGDTILFGWRGRQPQTRPRRFPKAHRTEAATAIPALFWTHWSTGRVHRMGTEIRFTKWGGRRHWQYPMEPLGRDGYGWWFGARAGVLLQRGFEDPIVQPHDFVVLVPADGCWIASWNAPGQTDISVYVDVTSRPLVQPDVVSAVDLDLDVVQLRDGTVRVLDEDEFAEHQLRYSYPAEVVEQARATTDDLVARLTTGTEPFATVGSAWLKRFADNG